MDSDGGVAVLGRIRVRERPRRVVPPSPRRAGIPFPKQIPLLMDFHIRGWFFLDPTEYTTWGRTIFALQGRGLNSMFMRHRRAAQILELYYGGAALFVNMAVPDVTTFDNIWTYFLVQRKNGTVSVYIGTGQEAVLWGSTDYDRAIDSPLLLGFSGQMPETPKGFLDKVELVVGQTVSEPDCF